MISTKKLIRVLRVIDRYGSVYATGGGEIAIAFTGQLDKHEHDYLRKKGFVLVDHDYVYRPR